MRELKIVGLDLDGKHIICEGDDPADKFRIRVDDRLRAGDARRRGPGEPNPHRHRGHATCCVPKRSRPGFARARRSSNSPTSAGVDIERVERFAHPVLLERARAAELATAAHPVLADGPAVLTLLETVTSSLVARGLNPTAPAGTRGATRTAAGPCSWAGRPAAPTTSRTSGSAPASHGGTVTAVDDPACELIDPDFDRPLLRPVAAVAQLDFDEPSKLQPCRRGPGRHRCPEAEPKAEQPRARRGKPAVPAWEDVLLGVRSSGAALTSGHRHQRQPARSATPDTAAKHQPAHHRCAPPPPHRRRQTADRHQIQPDGQQRVHPGQAQAQHHDRRPRSTDRDERRQRSDPLPRGGFVGHRPSSSPLARRTPGPRRWRR